MKPTRNPFLHLAFLALTLPAAAQLTWDPAMDGSTSGGAGTWDTTTTNWWNGAADVTWNNSGADEAIISNTGADYVINIADGGVTVGDLALQSGAGKISFRSVTDNLGLITIKPGGATWNTDGREIEFVNDQANDTPLAMTSGDTLSISGGGTFDTGEKPNGANWQVAGATLEIQDATTVRGNQFSLGAFGTLIFADGCTVFQERNSDQAFACDVELNGALEIRHRYNRRSNWSGIISGTGDITINPGEGNQKLVRFQNQNTFTGDIIIATGDDDEFGGFPAGLSITGQGTTGDPTNNIIFTGDNGIRFNQANPLSISGSISGAAPVLFTGAPVDLSGVNSYTGETYLNAGRVTISHIDALSLGSNIHFDGGDPFLNVAADLDTGNAADFTLPLGTGGGEVQWTSGGGFGAIGADRTVNIGGAGATITFGDTDFIPDTSGPALQLGSAESTHTLTIVNPVNLPTAATAYNFRSENGAAGIDGILAGVISGPGDFQKRGDGVLGLANGSNAWTGSTLVTEGVLLAGSSGSIPDITKVTVSSGAAFGGNTGTFGVSAFDNILANASFEPGSAVAFETSAGNFNYTSDLTGDVGVSKLGPNDLTLSGALSYTGPTTIYNGNIIFSGGSLPTGSALTLNDNVFDLQGNDLEVGGLASFQDSAAVVDSIGGATLTINTQEGTSFDFTGTLGQSGGGSNNFSLVKDGPGIQILAPANHYLGTTTVAGGRLVAPAPASLGATPASLDFSGITLTGGELRIEALGANPWTETDFYKLTGSLSTSATISGGAATLIGMVTESGWTPSSPISGDFGLRLIADLNSATYTWNFANSYTGDTILQTGTLTLTIDNAISATSVLEIVNNGTEGVVDLNGTNQTIAGLRDTGGGGSNTRSLDNTADGITSTLTIDVAADAYYNYGRNIRENTGFIDIIKDGPGMQVLQRPSGFAATNSALTINDGTLGLDSAFTNGTGEVTVNSNGTLELEGTLGMLTTVNGTLAPGILGDADNDGTPDSDPTVGTATVTNTVEFNDASTFEVEIADWNGGDNLGAVAGTDYDLLVATDLDFTSLTAGGLTVKIGDLVPADFTESNRTLVIMQASNTITGFDSSDITLDTSGFAGTGTWAIAQVGLNIELEYTAGSSNSYDTWISTNYPGVTGGFGDDDDGDGATNGAEWYFFESNPLVAESLGSPIADLTTTAPGTFTFKHLRPIDRSGIDEQYQWSVNLAEWLPSGATSGPTLVSISSGPPVLFKPGYELVTVTVTATPPTTAASVFARLVLTNP